MIVNEFSKLLQEHEQDIVSGKTAIEFLSQWLKDVLLKRPKTNTEKIIHSEIALCENKVGDFLLVAKSESGRVLTHSLYEFSKSFERHVLRKWLENKYPADFNDNVTN
ncbi:hypothetical protein IJ732_02290 [bacterium]|nr:hypothetical protein [bacterium]